MSTNPIYMGMSVCVQKGFRIIGIILILKEKLQCLANIFRCGNTFPPLFLCTQLSSHTDVVNKKNVTLLYLNQEAPKTQYVNYNYPSVLYPPTAISSHSSQVEFQVTVSWTALKMKTMTSMARTWGESGLWQPITQQFLFTSADPVCKAQRSSQRQIWIWKTRNLRCNQVSIQLLVWVSSNWLSGFYEHH